MRSKRGQFMGHLSIAIYLYQRHLIFHETALPPRKSCSEPTRRINRHPHLFRLRDRPHPVSKVYKIWHRHCIFINVRPPPWIGNNRFDVRVRTPIVTVEVSSEPKGPKSFRSGRIAIAISIKHVKRFAVRGHLNFGRARARTRLPEPGIRCGRFWDK